MDTHNFLTWRGYAALISGLAALASIALSPAVPAATVTYTGSSCTSFVVSGTPPNQTVTCVGGGGGGVPVCAPAASPTSPAINQAATITANCSNQPFATGYVWTGGPCLTQTGPTCTVTKSRATTVSFSITASNPAGTGTAAPISVTWH